MSDAGIVRNALGVAWSMPDAVLQHTDPRFKWWDGPLREAIDAAKPALDRLESQNQALQEALERMTHRCCGTNRVSQDVRWARQVLGWDYEKGCAQSVEAVRKSHAALSPTQETDPE